MKRGEIETEQKGKEKKNSTIRKERCKRLQRTGLLNEREKREGRKKM